MQLTSQFVHLDDMAGSLMLVVDADLCVLYFQSSVVCLSPHFDLEKS